MPLLSINVNSHTSGPSSTLQQQRISLQKQKAQDTCKVLGLERRCTVLITEIRNKKKDIEKQILEYEADKALLKSMNIQIPELKERISMNTELVVCIDAIFKKCKDTELIACIDAIIQEHNDKM